MLVPVLFGIIVEAVLKFDTEYTIILIDPDYNFKYRKLKLKLNVLVLSFLALVYSSKEISRQLFKKPLHAKYIDTRNSSQFLLIPNWLRLPGDIEDFRHVQVNAC